MLVFYRLVRQAAHGLPGLLANPRCVLLQSDGVEVGPLHRLWREGLQSLHQPRGLLLLAAPASIWTRYGVHIRQLLPVVRPAHRNLPREVKSGVDAAT